MQRFQRHLALPIGMQDRNQYKLDREQLLEALEPELGPNGFERWLVFA